MKTKGIATTAVMSIYMAAMTESKKPTAKPAYTATGLETALGDMVLSAFKEQGG